MGEVVSIITRQPITTHDEAVRITSASKFGKEYYPEWLNRSPLYKAKLDWLKNSGWQIYQFECGEVCARSPMVINPITGQQMWINIQQAENIQYAIDAGLAS